MCDCASPFPLSCRNLAGYLRSWQICASRLFRPTWLKESFSVISHDFTKAQLSVLPWTSQDISNHFKSYIACARLQTAMRSRGCSLERSSKRNKTPWTRHRTIGGVPWGQNTTFRSRKVHRITENLIFAVQTDLTALVFDPHPKISEELTKISKVFATSALV